MLARPALHAALSRSSFAARNAATLEVRRELPFASLQAATNKSPPELIVGRIDRVVIGRDPSGAVLFADVLDFKTDRLIDTTPAGVTTHASRYASQLRDYRRALARLLACPDNAITTRLAFVTHDVIA